MLIKQEILYYNTNLQTLNTRFNSGSTFCARNLGHAQLLN